MDIVTPYGTVYNKNCVDGLHDLTDSSIDLTVTSPPYDDLRKYQGYSFDFESVAKELYRVTKDGGTVVWIVNDATHNGSESGTSFRQALYFMECGFRLNDTMIWEKPGFTAVGALKYRYAQVFEYMFVFTKGQIKTFNPIKDRINKYAGKHKHGTIRQDDGSLRQMSSIGSTYNEYGIRFNVWQMPPVQSNVERTGHPAQFPEQLIHDHIISWSNEGDVVLDPFMGSGTTAKVAIDTKRKFVGFEISEEYCKIIEQRLKNKEIIA